MLCFLSLNGVDEYKTSPFTGLFAEDEVLSCGFFSSFNFFFLIVVRYFKTRMNTRIPTKKSKKGDRPLFSRFNQSYG